MSLDNARTSRDDRQSMSAIPRGQALAADTGVRVRRVRGTGTILTLHRQRAGGAVTRYRVRLPDPGRPGRLAFDATFVSFAEARRALQQAQAHVTLGEPIPVRRQRVRPLLDEYERAIRAMRKSRSYLSTERHLRLWIRPYFDGMLLQRMNNAAELRRYLTWLSAQTSTLTRRPLKAATRHHIFQVVSSFLEMCVQEGHIRRNAARDPFLGRESLRMRPRINLPNDNRGFASVAEAARYQVAALGSWYGDLCVFLLHTCMRSGEARGLRWGNVHLPDVDWPESPAYLEVLTQVVKRDRVPPLPGTMTPNPAGRGRGEGLQLTDELKSEASYRRIVLSATAVAILRRRQADLLAVRATARRWDSRYDLVFPTRLGTPAADNYVGRIHAGICARANVRPITLHGLRHTGLSILIAAGVTFDEVRRIAGHASFRELETVYVYALREFDGRGAAAMESMLPYLRTLPSVDHPDGAVMAAELLVGAATPLRIA